MMEKIDAIILAGGKGTRLQSVVSDLPKPLAPVNGRPFLDILLSQLDRCGCVNRLVLAVGHKSETVIDRYKDCTVYGFKILFSVEREPLGTGGAIKMALPLTESQDIMVLNGDSFVEVDIPNLIREHNSKNALLTMVLTEVDNAGRYGAVRVNRDKTVTAFEEKNDDYGPGLINAGIYILNRKLFDGIQDGKVISFEREILSDLIHGEATGYVTKGKFIDIGIPETYRISDEYLKEAV